MKIKRFYEQDEFSDESLDEKYEDLKETIKTMIETTIKNSGGEYDTFLNSFVRSPENYKIEGLINDNEIYEFYLKWRNDIDSLLNDINYFNEAPIENDVFGLYDYVIDGTKKAIHQASKLLLKS